MALKLITQLCISILFVTLVGMGFTLLTPILSTRIEEALGSALVLELPWIGLHVDLAGLRSTLLGVNLALGGVANLVAIPLVPALVSRFGGRTVAAACSLGMAACMAGFATTEIWMWFPLRFAFHMCLGSLFVITEYWVLSDSPAHIRGRVIGIYGTMLGLGFAIGPSILTLATAASFSPFYACMILFAAAACVLVFKSESQIEVDRRDKWMIVKVFRADPAVVIAGLMFGLFEFGAGSLFVNFAMRVGYTTEQALFALSLLFFSNVCFQLPLGVLSDRFNRRSLLIAISAIGLLGSAVLLAGKMPAAVFFPVVFLWSGSMAGLYTIGLAQSASMFEPKDFVHVNATFVTLYSVGMIFGPLYLSLGMDILNPFGFAYGLMTVFAAYLAFLSMTRTRVTSATAAEQP